MVTKRYEYYTIEIDTTLDGRYPCSVQEVYDTFEDALKDVYKFADAYYEKGNCSISKITISPTKPCPTREHWIIRDGKVYKHYDF